VVKKKIRKQKDEPKALPLPASIEKQVKETHNDFGGIPERDLKKNLGCG
jgi:hypothetical protein